MENAQGGRNIDGNQGVHWGAWNYGPQMLAMNLVKKEKYKMQS